MFSYYKYIASSSLWFLGVILIACNGNILVGGGTKKANPKLNSDENVQITDLENFEKNNLLDSLSGASFDEIQTISMADYIAATRDRMTNDPIVIEGQTFFDLKDFTDRHEDVYQNIGAQYATVGDLFNALGIASVNEILSENVKSGYKKLADAHESGKLDEFLSSELINNKTDSEVSQSELELTTPQENDNLSKAIIAIALLVPSSDGVQLALLDEGAPVAAAASANEADKFNWCITVIGKCDIGPHTIPIPPILPFQPEIVVSP